MDRAEKIPKFAQTTGTLDVFDPRSGISGQWDSACVCGVQSGSGTVLLFSPLTINRPILHTRLHLQVAVTRRTSGRSLGTLQKAAPFRDSGSFGREVLALTSR